MQTPPSRFEAPIEVRDSDTDSDNDNMTDVKQSKPQRPSKAEGRAKAVAAAIAAAAAPEPDSVPLPTPPAPGGGGGGGGGHDDLVLSQDPDEYEMAKNEKTGQQARKVLQRLEDLKDRRELVERYIRDALGESEAKAALACPDERLARLIDLASDYHISLWILSDSGGHFPSPAEHYALHSKPKTGVKRPRFMSFAAQAELKLARASMLEKAIDATVAAAVLAARAVTADSKDAAMADATESDRDSDSDEESDEPDTEEDVAATNAEMLIAEVIVDLKDGKLPGKDDRDIIDLYKMLGKHVEDHDDISGGGVSDRRAMGYLDRFVKYRRTLSGDLTLPIAQQLFDYCATVLDLELVVPGMKVSANPDAEPVAAARKSKRRKVEKSAPLPEHTEL